MEKKLKKFKRSELLELLLEVSIENEKLKERVRELEDKIDSHSMVITEKGSIAEVTIKINGMLEVIEKVNEIYNRNNNLNEEDELVTS